MKYIILEKRNKITKSGKSMIKNPGKGAYGRRGKYGLVSRRRIAAEEFKLGGKDLYFRICLHREDSIYLQIKNLRITGE